MSTMSTSVNMAFPDAIGNLSDDCGGTTGEKKANDPVDEAIGGQAEGALTNNFLRKGRQQKAGNLGGPLEWMSEFNVDDNSSGEEKDDADDHPRNARRSSQRTKRATFVSPKTPAKKKMERSGLRTGSDQNDKDKSSNELDATFRCPPPRKVDRGDDLQGKACDALVLEKTSDLVLENHTVSPLCIPDAVMHIGDVFFSAGAAKAQQADDAEDGDDDQNHPKPMACDGEAEKHSKGTHETGARVPAPSKAGSAGQSDPPAASPDEEKEKKGTHDHSLDDAEDTAPDAPPVAAQASPVCVDMGPKVSEDPPSDPQGGGTSSPPAHAQANAVDLERRCYEDVVRECDKHIQSVSEMCAHIDGKVARLKALKAHTDKVCL